MESPQPRSVGNLFCQWVHYNGGTLAMLFTFNGAEVKDGEITDRDVAISVMLAAEKQFVALAAKNGFLNVAPKRIERKVQRGAKPGSVEIHMATNVGFKPLSVPARRN